MEIEHLSKREVVPTKVPTASKEKEGGNRVNKPIQKKKKRVQRQNLM
jgi:hypothetical protein